MKHQHSFDTLLNSTMCLADHNRETELAGWLVIYATHRDDGLFFQTNAEALALELVQRFGGDTACLAFGFYGEKIVLLAPDASASAMAWASGCVAEMERGQHVNLAHYQQAQHDKCVERWSEMSLPARVQMVKDLAGSVRLALPDLPPGMVMQTLMQTFE